LGPKKQGRQAWRWR
jgi:hypothetical protein